MESRNRMALCCLFILLAIVGSSVDAAAVHSKRAVAETSPAGEALVKFCHTSTPCGWAVYVPFTRRVDYFMKNTCDCPKGKDCLRTEDDLSVSAYVYRCRPSPSSDKDKESS